MIRRLHGDLGIPAESLIKPSVESQMEAAKSIMREHRGVLRPLAR